MATITRILVINRIIWVKFLWLEFKNIDTEKMWLQGFQFCNLWNRKSTEDTPVRKGFCSLVDFLSGKYELYRNEWCAFHWFSVPIISKLKSPKDSTKCHTANTMFYLLKDKFADRIISRQGFVTGGQSHVIWYQAMSRHKSIPAILESSIISKPLFVELSLA